MTIKAASIELKVSYRQGKRIYAAYLNGGDRLLIHGNTGRQSNNRTAESIREAVQEAYRNRYRDFGPTFAAEKLVEGLWERKRQRSEYKSRRERQECFGELIQFDGSHHRWFEGRVLECCLITMIADRRGDDGLWITRYGIPQAP
jgi:hypothetical protein